MSHSHHVPMGLRRVWTLLFAFTPWLTSVAWPLQGLPAESSVTAAPTAAWIDRDRGLIRNAQQLHLNAAQVGSLWTRLGAEYQDRAMFTESEAAYNRGLAMLEREPEARSTYALALGNLGSLYMLTHRLDAAERCRRRSLEIYERLGDATAIARAKGYLGGVYLTMRRNKDAASFASQAIQGFAAASDEAGDDRTAAMLIYAYASCMSNNCADGL